MHRALNIYDIVDEIVSWLPETDLSVTIRVNKLWFRASKPFLWAVVNLHNALELLGPAETFGKNPHSPQNCINIPNWTRFCLYCQHVRVLRGKDTDSSPLFHAIRSHSSLLGNSDEKTYLFPACRRLYWHAAGTQVVEIQNISALIAPTVDYVCIGVYPEINCVWFQRFCNMLAVQQSRFRILRIEYEGESTELEHLTVVFCGSVI